MLSILKTDIVEKHLRAALLEMRTQIRERFSDCSSWNSTEKYTTGRRRSQSLKVGQVQVQVTEHLSNVARLALGEVDPDDEDDEQDVYHLPENGIWTEEIPHEVHEGRREEDG